MAQHFPSEFLCDKHANYFRRCLNILPPSQATMDINKLTIAYFAISGLDLLNRLDVINDKNRLIDWIYSLQIVPTDNAGDSIKTKKPKKGDHGFRGSFCNGTDNSYDCGNLAMTYCALVSLVVLGDDLARVEKTAIIKGLKEHQLQDGSFIPVVYEKENDMRFVYCAASICYILNDWSGIDVEKTVDFIKKSFTYECAFGQAPGLEAHGGSTFCAVASLYLMDHLNVLNAKELSLLKRWCLLKQSDGFQGRPNKDSDTCYSFWIGASLKLLNSYHLVNFNQNKHFILSTQDAITGGLAKYPDTVPDPLHSYLAVSGLALGPQSQSHLQPILPVDPALNISQRAADYLKHLHSKWKHSF